MQTDCNHMFCKECINGVLTGPVNKYVSVLMRKITVVQAQMSGLPP